MNNMKKRLLMVLSLFILAIMVLAVTLPVFSQEPVWTRVKTEGRTITVINESQDKIIVRWDNQLKNNETDDYVYLQSIILPKEDFIMPDCNYIYFSVPEDRVVQTDYAIITITD